MVDASPSYSRGNLLKLARTYALIVLVGLLGPGAAGAGRGALPVASVAGEPGVSVARAFSEPALEARFASLSPTLKALAGVGPARTLEASLSLTPGWERLDLASPPTFDLGAPDPAQAADEARLINALRPVSGAPVAPMPAFRLAAAPEDAARAVSCLSQAVY